MWSFGKDLKIQQMYPDLCFRNKVYSGFSVKKKCLGESPEQAEVSRTQSNRGRYVELVGRPQQDTPLPTQPRDGHSRCSVELPQECHWLPGFLVHTCADPCSSVPKEPPVSSASPSHRPWICLGRDLETCWFLQGTSLGRYQPRPFPLTYPILTTTTSPKPETASSHMRFRNSIERLQKVIHRQFRERKP